MREQCTQHDLVEAGSAVSHSALPYPVFVVPNSCSKSSNRRGVSCRDESCFQRAVGLGLRLGFLFKPFNVCFELCARRQKNHADSTFLLNSLPTFAVVANAKMKKELQEIENRILFLLSNSKGNILDDHELIETLASSKKTSTEITHKVRPLI